MAIVLGVDKLPLGKTMAEAEAEREKRVSALLAVCAAIIEAVEVAGEHGAPGGTLFAALMAHGCSLKAFEDIMSVLVNTGKLTKRGTAHHYFVVRKENK